MNAAFEDDHFDDKVDEEIRSYLDLDVPKSFFLYAGAGSGKTRSLVEALHYVSTKWGERLSLRGQQVAVITYTNAACDEIKRRLSFDPLIDVRTIHSFAWSLIERHDNDIRKWLAVNLRAQIEYLELKQAKAKGRAGKATEDRKRQIASKQKRLASLDDIRRFVYSPTGENRTRDSLNHSEVIAMTADFVTSKPLLQRLLFDHYPILLIDESQDTISAFMDAVLDLQAKHSATFCVGLFGDTMQRIYGHGKVGLDQAIPETWARPAKRMNHRCPTRVIRLINAIRAEDDGQEQRGRSDKPEGWVRLFILPEETDNKFEAEAHISKRMAEITGDGEWVASGNQVKTLTLEHHMAARRLGFQDFFDPLYRVEGMRTGLLDGTNPGASFFCRDVAPLVKAMATGDRFEAAKAVRKSSPLLDRKRLEAAGENQINSIREANAATEALYALFQSGSVPTLIEVLKNVARSGLFRIPEMLAPFVGTDAEGDDVDIGDWDVLIDDDDARDEIVAWRNALQTSFDQVEKYDLYVRDLSEFSTHQGVKGLEFPRVMVIISDEEARGFLFSFDKLFGTKEKSKADLENEEAGRETSINRTRRLFYVTCSRAEQSLAVVHYSAQPDVAKAGFIRRGWFEEEEVEVPS